MTLETEFEFTLPKGYVDGQGELHRAGVIRLATARDEIEPLRDPRVHQNEAYLTVIVLSRVVERLGSITQITPHEIEGLFTADLAYLQELYSIVNFGEPEDLEAFRADYGEHVVEMEPPNDESSEEGSPDRPFERRGGLIEEDVASK